MSLKCSNDAHKRYLAPLSFGCLLYFLPTAHAQESSQESEENKFEKILVTAQKRAQSAQDVGINMSVLGAEDIAIRKIESVTDLVVFTPNVTVKETFPGMMPIITMRGVGLNDYNATNSPTAGVYIDGMSLSSLALLNLDFFDVERIEVLRGPQGTLYGRNSTAGAINIFSAKPVTGDLFGSVGGTIADYQSREIEGMVNLPVSDTVALRFAVKGAWQDEGFWFNQNLGHDVGRRESLNARGTLLWEASDDFELMLKVEASKGRSELGAPEFFGVLPTGDLQIVCPGSPACSNFFGYSDTDNDPFNGSWSITPNYDLDQQSSLLRMQWDIGEVTITSLTGFIDFEREYSTDVDASPLRLTDFNNTDDVTQFSQEIHLASSNDDISWLSGVYYADDKVLTTYQGGFQDLFNTTTFTSSEQETTSMALFGNVEWHLSQYWDLITALRYTKEERANDGSTKDLVSLPGGSFLTQAPFGSPEITLASIDKSIEDRNWSWKLGLNWYPRKNSLIYMSASKGTKSGGFFSGVAASSDQLQPYEPEELVAYEVGMKNQWQDPGISLEGSVFYYDYSDVQTFIRETVGDLPIQRLGNVEEAEIYGMDANLIFKPKNVNGLDLIAGIGLLHTELGEFDSSVGLLPKGNRLPDAPNRTFNLGINYDYDLTDALWLNFSTDARFQSETYRDSLNDPLLKSEEYWVVNSQISFHSEDWRVTLYAKNITDKHYVTQGFNQVAFGNGYRVYGAPRMIGLSFSTNFE